MRSLLTPDKVSPREALAGSSHGGPVALSGSHWAGLLSVLGALWPG